MPAKLEGQAVEMSVMQRSLPLHHLGLAPLAFAIDR
jgi:hypothetical protein